MSLNLPKLVKSLVQKLVDGPPEEFMQTFEQYLDVHDPAQTKKKSVEYLLLKKALGSRLPSHVRQWMGRDDADSEDPDVIDIVEDIKLYADQLEALRDGQSEDSSQAVDKLSFQWKPHETACTDAYAMFSSTDDIGASGPHAIVAENAESDGFAAGGDSN